MEKELTRRFVELVCGLAFGAPAEKRVHLSGGPKVRLIASIRRACGRAASWPSGRKATNGNTTSGQVGGAECSPSKGLWGL